MHKTEREHIMSNIMKKAIPIEQYAAWVHTQKWPENDTSKSDINSEEKCFMPVFIPVCPNYLYPGKPPHSPTPPCPAVNPGIYPGLTSQPTGNAFILFLIFILLLLGTRKEQVLAVLRKIFK
ncbi:MAG: hypothetical protein A4E55_01577 [Pelotomaculum sp. PtaU1.Bin035]|nr:MAG: hypothetical protein A4E55_01577 [Pelotomaculum sp. PtaU1.Bin035]